MSETAHLSLPLIEAGQAQKHVTHNEALLLLDTAVQLAILSRTLATPPATPAEGDRYLVAAGAAGAWSSQAGTIATLQQGAWRFTIPQAGWRAWCQAETKLIVFDGTTWRDAGTVTELQNMALMGVNATADAANRLTVSSPGVLLTNEGSDIRLKLNKASAASTASLLFQDGFSGRAEFGLAGDDNFHVKVSANGTVWTEALTIDRTTGAVALPQGLAANSVGNVALADMPAARLKGTVAAGDPADLTGTQATALLDPFTTALKGLVPASGGGTANFLRADGTWAAPAGGGGGVSDGDKGDVVISGGGTVWTVDANAVTDAKLRQGAATSIIGRSAATAGNVADIAATADNTVLARAGGTVQFQSISGNMLNGSTIGNAKLATMATMTIKGNNTGASTNPADLTATQVTAMLDPFTAALKGLVPASGGGTTAFLRADGAWAAPPGGGGGGTGDVVGPASSADNAVARFDAATGKLLQNSVVTIQDDGSLTLPAVAAPATPAASTATLISRDMASRQLLAVVPPEGNEWLAQPFLGRSKVAWATSPGNSTTLTTTGLTLTASGTATARNVDVTNLFASARRTGYVSVATAGSSCGTRSANRQFWRGNAAGLGGFTFVASFGISDAAAVTDARLFAGLLANGAVIGNVNPSTLLNVVGVGSDSGDTVLSIITNDNAGTATKTSLGAAFPADTQSTDLYELALFCPPNAARIAYRVTRLNTGDVASGSLTADLPVNNQLMAPHFWRNNGTTALAVAIDVASLYIETDY